MIETAIEPEVVEKLTCYHCGSDCPDEKLKTDDHSFCCDGCLTVYQILSGNGMEQYYKLNNRPGTKTISRERFAALDSPEIADLFFKYRDGKTASVVFNLPSIHCSSCLWLLENLHKVDNRIIRVNVNFPSKEAHIYYQEDQLSLKDLALLLQRIGYPPHIAEIKDTSTNQVEYQKYIRLGVAGFCFGNIMLFSFPEYLGISESDQNFRTFFGILNIILSIPVFFYGGWPFLSAAWTGLKEKQLNIDVPIALGLVVMLIRSLYELLSGTGHGYIDSLAGLVFFMLLGRLFQDKSYRALSFEHDYKSFFPLAAAVIEDNEEKITPVKDIKPGDKIRIRSHEIIPADSKLTDGEAFIDFSFVTGEPAPVRVKKGETIYAGGRQTAGVIELEVLRPVSKGYLSTLWENDIFQKPKKSRAMLIDRISHVFTPVVLLIAIISGIGWWLSGDINTAINAFTAVLIIACPCALALSAPFAYGNATRILARKGFYLRNSQVIESLADVDMVVLDKTGTLTDSKGSEVIYDGNALSEEEKEWISALASQSVHPLSRAISASFPENGSNSLSEVEEIKGKGIRAYCGDKELRLGSGVFTGVLGEVKKGTVYFSVDGEVRGHFRINQKYRTNMEHMLEDLSSTTKVAVLSGDSDAERNFLTSLLPEDSEIHFNQQPIDKLEKVERFKNNGSKVLMAGDGLNDAGALKAADFGISVAEDSTQFTPSCEGILSATALYQLPKYLQFSKATVRAVKFCIALSFAYNIVGLFYASSGMLSPVFAAILMPLSSVSVVVLSTALTHSASSKIYGNGFRGISE